MFSLMPPPAPGGTVSQSSSVPNYSAQDHAQTAPSPAGKERQPERKRRRKALACYDCRRRKLKCDRTYPACERCIKSGQRDSCHYDTPPGSQAKEASTSADEDMMEGHDDVVAEAVHIFAPRQMDTTHRKRSLAPVDPLSKSMLQERRFAQLEDRLARLEAQTLIRSDPTRRPIIPPDGVQRPDLDMVYFKGRGFRTQFYGGTNPTSMISQFPELRTFMKDTIMQHPSLARVQNDLRSVNGRVKAQIVPPSFDHGSLLAMVPPKPATERMIRLYLDTLEKLYRVLHIPSFWHEYHNFWLNPSQAKTSFIVTMLLMMSSVITMSSESKIVFVGKSAQARETAIKWVGACDEWIHRQSYKHSDIVVLQARLIMDVSKHMNSIKKKRAWEQAGENLRFAMAIGLHRDPGRLVGKMSYFDNQMRRRLWATVDEWELQAAITKGFPAGSLNILSDIGPPLNLDDDSFAPTSTHEIQPRPSQEYSDASFLHMAQQSLQLRKSLSSLVNNAGSPLGYEEVLSYEEKIMHQIEAIPSWDDHNMPGGGGSDPWILPTALLDIQLRQFLIWLHFPFASRSDTRHSYSKTACFNAASTILDLHSKLMARGEYTLCLLRNDGYLAALCICHNVFAASLLRSDTIFKSLHISFSQFVEEGLRMLEEKVMRLGECRNHFWFISAAYSFVQVKVAPETARSARQAAVDRATRLFYRIMASQDERAGESKAAGAVAGIVKGVEMSARSDNGSLPLLPTPTPTVGGASGTFSPINSPGAVTVMGPGNAQGMAGTQDPFDPFGPFLSEWALDDLWPLEDMEAY